MASGKTYIRNAANDAWIAMATGSGTGGGAATSIDFAFLTMSADQTTDLTVNNPIKLNTATGTITWNTSTYIGTLSSGSTYLLYAVGSAHYTGVNGWVTMAWYDITNSAILSNLCYVNSPENTSADENPQPTAFAIVTPATDITVDFRITGVALIDKIFSKSAAFILKIK